MKWNMLISLAIFSALTIGCNKDKGAESPEDVGDGPMEEAGESVDEAAAESEETLGDAADDVEEAVDEVGDDLDGDPTTD